MKSFSSILTPDEMALVAGFIIDQFVQQQKINTRYHTVANGWPDHEEKYSVAFPFVLGDIAPPYNWAELTPEQSRGLNLFNNTCISCHELPSQKDNGKVWEKYPLSHQGCGVRCHDDGRVDFPWSRSQRPSTLDSVAKLNSPYVAHGRPPQLSNLTLIEQQGESLYQKNCAFCHAMDGTGGNWIGTFLEPHPRDLTLAKTAKHLPSEKLNTVISDGLPGTSMSAWRHVLNKNQIKAIIAYIERAFFDNRTNEQVR